MTTMLDTIRLYETPEGIDLGVRLAGPGPRALAQLMDLLIRAAVYIVLLPLLGLAGVGGGLLLLATFLLEWFYPVWFETRSGSTPGKRMMGLMVVHDDGTPVALPASMIRNLLRVVDFLPLFYGVGLASTLIDRDFRRLGDLAAGTLVVYIERRERKPVIPLTPLAAVPPPFSVETQQAILSFAERGQNLSLARRIELAEILTADDGVYGADALARVQSWADWLAHGHRDPQS